MLAIRSPRRRKAESEIFGIVWLQALLDLCNRYMSFALTHKIYYVISMKKHCNKPAVISIMEDERAKSRKQF